MRPPLASSLLVLALSFLLTIPARAGVILSELCDPLSNFATDRYIEVFNAGPGDVDLTGWSVVAIANGANALTWNLSGTLPVGQARVCGYPTTAFTVHFPNSAWTTTVTNQGSFNWNGQINDGARLVGPGAVVVDLIVAPGTLFRDGTLVRNSNVTSGSPSGYVTSEWTFTAVTFATQATPGTHNGGAPPPAGPSISNIVTDPAVPAASQTVNVQAAVTHAGGAPSSVTLQWGSAAASLSNSIAMTLLADSTYRTSTAIPGQLPGASVYYRISAVGSGITTNSATLSFTIPGAGGTPPTITALGQTSDSTVRVFFSEPVDEVTAEQAGNYSVGTLVGVSAVRDPLATSEVEVVIRNIAAGSRILTVNGVADLGGSTAFGATRTFNWVDVSIPAGYYASTTGLKGSELRKALHLIIRNHTVRSYDFALTAYSTTDVKPNGKIWDVYSDIPGGTPAYEYAYGQTGQGAGEGFGYNREHTFPQSWFNSASPMDSDLHMLYPTDAYVNNRRANYPFGVVGTPTWTSTNGSKLGNSVTPGYTGIVFEPAGPFKGDMARAHLYVSVRYLGQDAGWPGSPSAVGSQYVAWARDQYRQWHTTDPVSWKERLRNGAVYVHQGNRNPFVDHPEFLAAILDTNVVSGVGDDAFGVASLRPASPNPFLARTNLAFTLSQPGRVSLSVYDVGGRLVRTLAADQSYAAGLHRLEWDGRDEAGAAADAGLFFVRLDAGGVTRTQRLVRMR
ncbi:MAG: endonuclease [bacterium]